MSNISTLNAPVIDQNTASKMVKNMIKRNSKRPLMFFGKGGIGKTESIAQIAKELNMGYVDVRLLLYTETDLKGIPSVNAERTATIWLQNDILPIEDRDGKSGILVFDEITSCPRSVRTAAYQLLNERRLGEYVLPEGWFMVCLGNGEEDGGHFNGMEANFANRCTVAEIEPSVSSWKEWAIKNGVNPLVTAYVSWKEADIHTLKPDNESEIVFASPRSWKAVSDILNEEEFNDKDLALRAEVLGNIGNLVGGQFWAFCSYKEKIVEPSKILSGKSKSHPKSGGVLFLTIQSLIHLMDQTVKDYLNTGKDIKDITSDKEIMDKFLNGIKWILGLDALEHQTMAIKDFITINQEASRVIIMNPTFLKSCPELLEFTTKNEYIFL